MTTKQYDNYADLITFTRASTGTYLDSDGLLKTASTNVPRIEYDASGNRKGLLIEEARTNLLTYSEDFTNAAWSKVRSSVSLTETNPFGVPNSAVKLVQDATAASSHKIEFPLTYTNTAHTFSLFAKAAEVSEIALQITSVVSAPVAIFDLSSGAIGFVGSGLSAQIQSFGNGWYRCSISGTAVSGASSVQIYLVEAGSLAFDGDGTSGAVIYGAQLEAAPTPSSYIPTSGATATRSADVASIPTSAFGYNQKAGTVVVDFDRNQNAVGAYAAQIGAVGGNNIGFNGGIGTPSQQRFDVQTNATTVAQIILTNSIVTDTPYKIAGAFADDDFAGFINGSLAGSDTSGTLPQGNFTLYLGTHTGGTYLNGHIKSIQYYPRRLTNTQLQELTA